MNSYNSIKRIPHIDRFKSIRNQQEVPLQELLDITAPNTYQHDVRDSRSDIDMIYRQLDRKNQRAVEQFFGRLSVRFNVIARQRIWSEHDAEEVAQSAILVILAKYEDTDIKSSFAAWANQILEYEILSYYKKKARRTLRFGQIVNTDHPAVDWNPDPRLVQRLLKCLRLIGSKNRNYARILNLHYLGFDVSEVADRMKATANNLYVILWRARSMLTKCLEDGKLL
jgi:RNA polymerase sigma factor (sigma-70 family)